MIEGLFTPALLRVTDSTVEPRGPKFVPVIVTVPPTVSTDVTDVTVGLAYLNTVFAAEVREAPSLVSLTCRSRLPPKPAGTVHFNCVWDTTFTDEHV